MEYGRVVDYKITFKGAPLDRRMLVISAMGHPLGSEDRRAIRGSGAEIISNRTALPAIEMPPATESNLRGYSRSRPEAAKYVATSFGQLCFFRMMRSTPPEGPTVQSSDFVDILMGDEAVVPVFGSPPNAWLPLKDVMAYGAGTFAAVGNSGSVPTLILAFGGVVVLVRFIDPIVASVGSALADGIGNSIRKAFGLAQQPQISQLEAVDEADPSVGSADAPELE
jgi:hypothetical protein